jgi:hypothetical protein
MAFAFSFLEVPIADLFLIPTATCLIKLAVVALLCHPEYYYSSGEQS